jgi:hypothetical protein
MTYNTIHDHLIGVWEVHPRLTAMLLCPASRKMVMGSRGAPS